MLRHEIADGAATGALTKLFSDSEEILQACLHAVSQRPVSYRGQSLTPTMLRRMGNCPPPARTKVTSAPRARAGRATQAIRVLSWNAGHLGQQQWSEIKSWLSTEASQTCDVLADETHWQATAEPGTASRLPFQTTRLRLRKARKAAGARPRLSMKRRRGLRAVKTDCSQVPL